MGKIVINLSVRMATIEHSVRIVWAIMLLGQSCQNSYEKDV